MFPDPKVVLKDFKFLLVDTEFLLAEFKFQPARFKIKEGQLDVFFDHPGSSPCSRTPTSCSRTSNSYL